MFYLDLFRVLEENRPGRAVLDLPTQHLNTVLMGSNGSTDERFANGHVFAVREAAIEHVRELPTAALWHQCFQTDDLLPDPRWSGRTAADAFLLHKRFAPPEAG